MAFEKGHTKMGGRQKGTFNKRTLLKAEELLLQLDINPIQKLIELAESDEATIDQKINCYKEISKYTYPKLKSQEVYIESESIMPTVIEIVAYGEDKVDEDKT